VRMKVTNVVLQSPCNQLLQSCLANQLYDYYNADLARIAAGTTPLYMVSRWGGGNPNAQQVQPPMLQTGQHSCPFLDTYMWMTLLSLPTPNVFQRFLKM